MGPRSNALALLIWCHAAGCGGASEPAATEPVRPAPAAVEELSAPTPEEAAAPAVMAYPALDEQGWIWLDLGEMRSMEGWDRLSQALRGALSGWSEMEPLFGTPADPLVHASTLTLSVGAIPIARVTTLELSDPSTTRQAVEGIATSSWVPVAEAEMAALSNADDAPTIAVDGERRIVVAAPGYMRGALRTGVQRIEPFWDSAAILVLAVPGGLLGGTDPIEDLRLWAAGADGGDLHVVATARTTDAARAEEAAARIEEGRARWSESPMLQLVGLRDAVTDMRIRAEGPEVVAETYLTERQAVALLAIGLEALTRHLDQLREEARESGPSP